MKCPKCGINNGDTNKFCRECGYRLESLTKQQTQPDASLPDDELALGEELFDVWQLYTTGELENALDKLLKVVRAHPDSASAHSILALIYERKAENESATGNNKAAEELLQQAVSHYEIIVELNPKSAADREKLASLQIKISGESLDPPTESVPVSVKPLDFKAALKSVPTPILVSAAVFLVVLMLAIIRFPSPKHDPVTVTVSAKDVATQSAEAAPAVTPRPLRIYTFPEPTQTAPPKPSALQTPTPAISIPGVQPMKLPPIGQVTIVPSSKDKSKDAKKSTSAQPKQAASKDKPTGPDGASMLADAIELHNQGQSADAIASALEASKLFQNEIDAGKNTTTAKRGLENTRKMIEVWRQAEPPSQEQ